MAVKRSLGYGPLALAVIFAVAAGSVRFLGLDSDVGGVSTGLLVAKGLWITAICFAGYGTYQLARWALVEGASSKRRGHDVRNVLRLAFGLATTVAVLGVLTDQWLGVLFSLGVVGFFSRALPSRMVRGA